MNCIIVVLMMVETVIDNGTIDTTPHGTIYDGTMIMTFTKQ